VHRRAHDYQDHRDRMAAATKFPEDHLQTYPQESGRAEKPAHCLGRRLRMATLFSRERAEVYNFLRQHGVKTAGGASTPPQVSVAAPVHRQIDPFGVISCVRSANSRGTTTLSPIPRRRPLFPRFFVSHEQITKKKRGRSWSDATSRSIGTP